MGKSKAHQWFLEAKVVPKEQRVFVRKQMAELRKQAEFWDYLNLVWRKYQRKKCYYCGTKIATSPNAHFKHQVPRDWEIDHKLAVYYGGTNAPVNLCIACKPCNRYKSADLLERSPATLSQSKHMKAKKKLSGKIYF